MSEQSSDRMGLPAYKGYEYQILTTVWLALELMLARSGPCAEIEVEPASEEDIRARLDVSHEQALSTLRLPAREELQIQIKYRSRPLGSTAFKEIVSPSSARRPQKGPTPRLRPVEYLSRSDETTYILVTSAQVEAKLAGHRIQDLDERPSSTTGLPFPSRLPKEEQARIARRLCILDQQTRETVRGRIEKHLRERAHIPSTRLTACTNEMKSRVRERLLGNVGRHWPREELLDVLRQFGGLPEHPHENFVPPSNFERLADQLEQRFALVLYGPPGVGKSTVADILAYRHKVGAEPFEVLQENLSPGKIRQALRSPGRTLFYLEDPWGSGTPAPDVHRWRTEMAYLLTEAGPDKRFLITSRTGNLRGGGGDAKLSDTISEVAEELLPAHYSPEDRLRILEQELRGTPQAQDFVVAHEEQIVSKLDVPFSLRHFGRRLRKKPSLSLEELEEALKRSLMEVIGNTVAGEVREGSIASVVPGALAGFLLFLRNPIDAEEVKAFAGVLRDSGRTGIELEAMFHRLHLEGWLELRAEGYWAHPQVMDGLLSLFETAPETVTDALVEWLCALIAASMLSGTIRLVFALEQRKRPLPPDVAHALDTFLGEYVTQESDEGFSEALERFSLFSRGVTPEALVARRLVGLVEGFTRFNDIWMPAEWTPAERQAVQTSPGARALAGRFVRFGWLASRRKYGWERFSSWSRDLGWDFTEDLRFAARNALAEAGARDLPEPTSSGLNDAFDINLRQILEGALEAPDAPAEELLLLALDALGRTRQLLDSETRSLRVTAGFQTQEMFRERPLKARCLAYEHALATVVDIRRCREGHAWAVDHPRRAEIVPAFFQSIFAAILPTTTFLGRRWSVDRQSASLDELAALHEAASPDDRRWLWNLMAVIRASELLPKLLDDLRACPLEHLTSGIHALHSLAGEEFPGVLARLMESIEFARRVALAEARRGKDSSRPLEGLTPSELEVVTLCTAAIGKAPPESAVRKLSSEQQTWLRQLASQNPGVLGLGALLVLAVSGSPLEEVFSTSKVLSQDVLLPLALHLLLGRDVPGAHDLVSAHLAHESAKVRAAALALLAPRATSMERERIIGMAGDPSVLVQRECALQIGAMAWGDGTDALFKLLAAPAVTHGWDHPHASPVARAAAKALVGLPSLTEPDFERCLGFIEQGVQATLDSYARCDLLPLLARNPSTKALRVLEACMKSREAIQVRNGALSFPLRYAGAWFLLQHLRRYPEARAEVRVEDLGWAARHTDASLAVPALIVLGLLTSRAWQCMRQVLTDDTMTSRRALLLSVGFVLSGEDRPVMEQAFARAVDAADAPGLQLLEQVRVGLGDGRTPDLALCREPEAMTWMAGLQAEERVPRALRWCFFELFGRRAEDPLCLEGMTPGQVLTEDQSLTWLAQKEWRGVDHD
ncbi:hypothetical protein HPC49_33055 [Pyxidicoccus fallax]|uniref:Novel STAND NTPase 3 domain-containing protein n=1 Tax=Pyxidicoccus fallax TaxID=394095 RepID=A0A848LF03_9BACT|nr:hypothetical protein [Pyxidicoccus fallax]NMO16852.1 hypothetical protein [Pyxidicoccus fallax]NPC83038.1 hypothetical protein [Pyxidicoccus fallax]